MRLRAGSALLILACLSAVVYTSEGRRHLRKTVHDEDLDDELGQKHTERLFQLDEPSAVESPWEKYAQSQKTANIVEDEDDGAYCHKMALRRCGNSFMKVFQLFGFLQEDQAYQAKCALRTAFYSCLKKFSLTPCNKPRRFHIEERFRKRLADSLWSARACLLAVRPPHHNNKN